MKRSGQPPFWLLFGAGGMLSALIGAMLVFITGIAGPLGILMPADAMEFPAMSAFAQHWAGKAFIFSVVSLFLWHAAHRIFHTLHDFGLHTGLVAWLCCYGVAAAGTVACGASLLAIGW